MENNGMKLYHNSWEEKYRMPFGAVKRGTQITLFVATERICRVWLEIHRDFEEQESIEMSAAAGGFSVTVQVAETILHYYHFRALTDEGEMIVYGNNEREYGGEGQIAAAGRRLLDYQITVYDYDDFAPLWYRKGVAYHIFIDRFSVGEGGIKEPKENIFFYGRKTDLPMYIKDGKGEIIRWDFFGGDLWGILEKLPYLKELGISILYLSPLFAARSNHRYDTGDYMRIEPMIGGEEAFAALIKGAGQLGIKIILDGVFNHCGADSIYFDRCNRYGGGAFHNESSPYRQWFHITEDQKYDAWWGVTDLPRFNGKSEALRSFLLNVVSKWSSYGIGGWRLDVADELEDEFIEQLRGCLKEDQVLLGEVWEDPSNKIAYGKRRYYVKGNRLHGVMNYPYRECILAYLSGEIGAGEASGRFRHYMENFPPHVFYNNLNNLGSHDTIRLITALNMDIRLVKLSVVLLFMLPGVPCVYYGDEIGLPGREDPDNRRFFLWDQINNELHQFFQEMIRYRNNHEVLAFGDLQVIARGELLAVIRHYKGEWIYACFNPCDREQYLEDFGYGISAAIKPKDYLIHKS